MPASPAASVVKWRSIEPPVETIDGGIAEPVYEATSGAAVLAPS